MDRAEWHVSVLYNDQYHLAGTFMEDGMLNNSTNITPLDRLYLYLSIDLTNNTPSLHLTISREPDGSLPLSDLEISELDIMFKIEPIYQYCRLGHSDTDEIFCVVQTL